MSGAGDWGTNKARNRLQKDTPGQKVGEEKMEPFKLDGRTKAFKEKVKKLAYKKQKLNAQAIKLLDPKDFDNPLKGYPYNERMTKEHSEELIAFVKNANEAGVEPTELMDAVQNWMTIKGYTQVKEELDENFDKDPDIKKISMATNLFAKDELVKLKDFIAKNKLDKKKIVKDLDKKKNQLQHIRDVILNPSKKSRLAPKIIQNYKEDLDEQWGVENPYLRYDNDKLKKLKTQHKDNYGKLKNKIGKMMGVGGAAPQGLKDELKDLERKIKQVEDAIKMKPFVKKESKDIQSFGQFNEAKVTMAKLKPGMTFDVIHKGRSARNFGVNGQNVYGGKVKVLGMGNVPFKKKAEKKHVFAKDLKDAQNKFRDIWNKEEIRYGYFGSSLGRIKAFFNAIAAESEGKKIPYGHTCWIWEVIEGENKGTISYCFISFDEKWEVVFLNKATEFELIS